MAKNISVLEKVANFIQHLQEDGTILNERESEALASAKSLLVAADIIDKHFNEKGNDKS